MDMCRSAGAKIILTLFWILHSESACELVHFFTFIVTFAVFCSLEERKLQGVVIVVLKYLKKVYKNMEIDFLLGLVQIEDVPAPCKGCWTR